MLLAVGKRTATVQIDAAAIETKLAAWRLHDDLTATCAVETGEGAVTVYATLDGSPAAVALFAHLHGKGYDEGRLRERAEAAGIDWRPPDAAPAPMELAAMADPPPEEPPVVPYPPGERADG